MTQVSWHRSGLYFTAYVHEEDWGEEGKGYEVENIEAELDLEPIDDADMQRVCEWWGIDLVSNLGEIIERYYDELKQEAIDCYLEVYG
jgi:hypothetical protein